MLKGLVKAVLPPRVWARVVRGRIIAEREWGLLGAFGWNAYLRLQFPARRAPGPRPPLRRVALKGFRHPVYFRPGTSDRLVVQQVFALREYDCVLGETDVRYILDCGANIGLATYFLMHRFPDARAVVVEPDPGNMRVCRKNLAPWADRVTFVEAGVWSASVPLVLERGTYRDGAEWSIQVRPAQPGEPPDLTALTVSDLLARGGFPRADILKMDIEAAEEEVFRTGAAEWLGRVRTLVVETHGPACERAVFGAVEGVPHTAERCGENTVFRFPHAPPSASGDAR